jgi:hypothetical protein
MVGSSWGRRCVFIGELFDDAHPSIKKDGWRLRGTTTIRDDGANSKSYGPTLKWILSRARRVKPSPHHREAAELGICNALIRLSSRPAT